MKIGIFAPLDQFLTDIVGLWKEQGHEIVHLPSTQDPALTLTAATQLLNTCDVCWFEFCEQLAAMCSHIPATKAKTIIRVHGLDIWEPYLQQTNWNFFNQVVTVSPFTDTVFRNRVPSEIRPPTTMIFNGVNTDRFKMAEERVYTKHAGIAGNIVPKKGIWHFLHVFKQVIERDPEWILTIKGNLTQNVWNSTEVWRYWDTLVYYLKNNEMMDAIRQEERSSGNEYVSWFWTQDMIISSSWLEGFHFTPMEGLSTGCYALVNDWPDAEIFYPDDCLYKTEQEAVEKMYNYGQLTAGEKMEISVKMREHVVNNHNIKDRFKEINKLIE